ncbi:MAG: hypothetical protein IKO47_10845 [Ruminococcus sp.]|nr:hypothetical protein [Ruminococcus sp.]
MITRNYKIAGKVVEISSLLNDVHDYCADYLTDEPADYSVVTSMDDIVFEREKSAHENELEGRPVHYYPDGYLEELAVYRKIADKMLDYDTILFHGSVIAVDGQGYLFTAKSGTGKSTHTSLWMKYFGDKAVMVNDDKPLLAVTEEGVTAYGTPYNGKHRRGANISVPLKAICILTRAENNSIAPVLPIQVYPLLIQQVNRPADPLKMQKTLELVDRLSEKTKLYKLGCNMDISAAVTAYEGMR